MSSMQSSKSKTSRANRSMLRIALPLIIILLTGRADAADRPNSDQPNIVFAIADDWGWPHAGAYGDQVCKTPAFDRLAKEGVLFNHAYISSPSCTPSRGAILTGQYHWRLEGAGNLWSVFPDKFSVYPEILEKAGYVSGLSGKGWGPGRTQSKGRNVAGKRFKNFQEFLAKRNKEDKDKPFVYWLGTSDPHRPFKKDAWKAAGMDLSKVHMFGFYPDHPTVRGDIADYYVEVQRWDTLVAKAIKSLEDLGELDNTIIVMTGDHGMPFPRCKSNLYDSGARVPLAIRWGKNITGQRTLDEFVSLVDLAPTFLEAAGIDIPEDMSGRSLMPMLTGDKQARVGSVDRTFVIHGKERHVPSQEAPDMGGYPSRAIRTHDFLYIRNYKPERWPNGTPHYQKASVKNTWYGDTDNGPSKTYIIDNKDKDDAHRRAYKLCFAKRPAEELYDLKNDPEQLVNVAEGKAYAKTKFKLSAKLTEQLKATKDPREFGGGEKFDEFPYLGGGPRFPGKKKK